MQSYLPDPPRTYRAAFVVPPTAGRATALCRPFCSRTCLTMTVSIRVRRKQTPGGFILLFAGGNAVTRDNRTMFISDERFSKLNPLKSTKKKKLMIKDRSIKKSTKWLLLVC